MTPEEYEAETIMRAQEGDAEAGREAIQLSISGLYTGQLSESLRFYLAGCLNNFVSGVPIARAMRVEQQRPRGRPSNHFPEWEEPLAAFAAILAKRGFRAEQINRAMSDANEMMKGRELERSEAQRIRKTYAPMILLSERILLTMCSPAMREKMDQYLTQT